MTSPRIAEWEKRKIAEERMKIRFPILRWRRKKKGDVNGKSKRRRSSK